MVRCCDAQPRRHLWPLTGTGRKQDASAFHFDWCGRLAAEPVNTGEAPTKEDENPKVLSNCSAAAATNQLAGWLPGTMLSKRALAGQNASPSSIGPRGRVWRRRCKTSPLQLTRFPKGESLQDVMARTSDVLREALLRYPEQTVVLVGHDSVNRVLLLHLLDMPLSAYWRLVQDPCILNEIEIFPAGDAQVQRLNDTSHLDQA